MKNNKPKVTVPASAVPFFRLSACNTMVICTTQAAHDLRVLLDHANNFAQECRNRLPLASIEMLEGLLGKVEGISNSYRPAGLQRNRANLSELYLPVATARKIFGTQLVLDQIAFELKKTPEGLKRLEQSTAWADLEADKKRMLPTLTAIHESLGNVRERQVVESGVVFALRSIQTGNRVDIALIVSRPRPVSVTAPQ